MVAHGRVGPLLRDEFQYLYFMDIKKLKECESSLNSPVSDAVHRSPVGDSLHQSPRVLSEGPRGTPHCGVEVGELPHLPSPLMGTPIRNKSTENHREDAGWSPSRLHSRRNRNRRTNITNQIIDKPELSTFNRFFILESLEKERTLDDLGEFELFDDIEKECKGLPDTFKILRNGTMLVKSKNTTQSQTIQQINKLAGMKVKVSAHRGLNSSKGTVLARKWDRYTDEMLCEHLKREGVIDVKKLPSRPDKTYKGERYLLTFNRIHPPEKIRGGLQMLQVREFIPSPRRCFNCQGFGHIGFHCKREQGICVKCSETTHVAQREPCNRAPLCRNCGGDHPASDKNCSVFKMEQEIITIATKEKVSFAEARRKTRARYPNATKSYADMVKKRRIQHAEKAQTFSKDLRENVPIIPPRPMPREEAKRAPQGAHRYPREASPHHSKCLPHHSQTTIEVHPLPSRIISDDPPNKDTTTKNKKLRRSANSISDMEMSDEHSSPTKRKLPAKQSAGKTQATTAKDFLKSESQVHQSKPKRENRKRCNATDRKNKKDEVDENLALLHRGGKGGEPHLREFLTLPNLPLPTLQVCTPPAGVGVVADCHNDNQSQHIKVLVSNQSQKPSPSSQQLANPRDPRIRKFSL